MINKDKLAIPERLYQCKKPIIGITGSIASGKSSVTKLLQESGFEIICADSLVKTIYSLPEVIQTVSEIVPNAFNGSIIDFKILRAQVFKSEEIKNKIENLIYSYLPEQFMKAANNIKGPVIFYDVPLLFEKGLDQKVDLSVCVYAPKNVLISRLIIRDQIDQDLASKMLHSQLDIELKKDKSDYVINNDSSHQNLKKNVEQFVFDIKNWIESAN